jgi:hypothetical protein
MRTSRVSKIALVLAGAASLVLSAATSRAAEISVGSITVRPNEEGNVAVTLNVESGETALGALIDVGFEAGASVPARLGVAAILAADIAADDTAIPVGDASDLQAFGTVQIGDELISYGRKDGNTLVAGGCTGGGGRTACIDSNECSAGGTCAPAGRGQGGTTPAAHAANDGIGTPATPNCTVSAALDALNLDAVFSYLPPDCLPGTDCQTVRALVIALDSLNPFPTGSTTLYSCRIAAGEVQATFPLVCANGQVSDSLEGTGLIADGPCTNGQVVVSTVEPTSTPTATHTITPGDPTATPTVTPTVTPTAVPCIGDCDLDGKVSVAELVQGMNIALGLLALEQCPAFDADGNEVLTVDELIQAVAAALDSCP